MIDWTVVKRAFHQWIVAGSGVPAGRVRWAEGAPRSGTGPWISLRVTGIRKIGQDSKSSYVADVPAPGAEILHVARGLRECELTVQCFGGSGPEGAAERLDRVQAIFPLPSIRELLRVAQVGIGRISKVQAIDGFLGESTFEARALMRVTFFLPSEVVEAGTIIEFVEIEPQDPPGGEPFFAPEEPA
jgi:hypothetical protein